jgi:hypothetical protein
LLNVRLCCVNKVVMVARPARRRNFGVLEALPALCGTGTSFDPRRAGVGLY